jgi:hypothetical protein
MRSADAGIAQIAAIMSTAIAKAISFFMLNLL